MDDYKKIYITQGLTRITVIEIHIDSQAGEEPRTQWCSTIDHNHRERYVSSPSLVIRMLIYICTCITDVAIPCYRNQDVRPTNNTISARKPVIGRNYIWEF